MGKWQKAFAKGHVEVALADWPRMVSPFALGVPIAAAGLLVGQALMSAALRAPAGRNPMVDAQGNPLPNAQSMGLVLRAVPVTGLLFTFVVAMLATTAEPPVDDELPHLVLGTAAAIQAVAQGLIVRSRFPSVAADPTGFGRLLVRCMLPGFLTLVAFGYAFLAVVGG